MSRVPTATIRSMRRLLQAFIACFRPGLDPPTGSAEAAALVVRAEEVLGAGARHRRRGRDLEGQRGGGGDLREAVDGPGAEAAEQREPVARGRQRRAAADR